MACYEATCHAIWLRNFILASEVNHSISRLLKLFCDNSTTISFSRSTSLFKPRMKISVLTDISVLGFYGYIGYIGNISMDIFT